jgi:hypothetical protein
MLLDGVAFLIDLLPGFFADNDMDDLLFLLVRVVVSVIHNPVRPPSVETLGYSTPSPGDEDHEAMDRVAPFPTSGNERRKPRKSKFLPSLGDGGEIAQRFNAGRS